MDAMENATQNVAHARPVPVILPSRNVAKHRCAKENHPQMPLSYDTVLDEMVAICVRCSRIGTTSMTLQFELHCGDGEDLRATGEEVHVNVGEVRGRPTPLADAVVACFEAFEGRSLRSPALRNPA